MRTNLRIKLAVITSSVLVIVLASMWLINQPSSNETEEESRLSFYHSICHTDTIERNYPSTIELIIDEDTSKHQIVSMNEIQTIDHGTDYQITGRKTDKENRTILTGCLDARKYSFKEGNRPFNVISALPRELRVTNKGGNHTLHTIPSEIEITKLRKDKHDFPVFAVENDYYLDYQFPSTIGGTEILLDITSAKAEIIGLCLFNDKGEKVDIYLSLPEENLVMERTGSSNRLKNIPEPTKATIQKADKYRLDIFVDNYSVEIFLNDGATTMSNLVFPIEPYNRMSFYAKGGSYVVDTFNVYRLGL